jgi:uncharacterized protein (DUF1499 family)
MAMLAMRGFRAILCSRIIGITSLLLVAGTTGCTGRAPDNLGIHDGKLSPCPASPNCVSSRSADKDHVVEPFFYTSSRQQALADIKQIILHMKRAKIANESGNYLHVEFTSAIWHFVDDVEFYFEENAKIIQVRSASRVGKSDFGVNRKRVEAIRAAWNAMEKRL